MNTKFLYVRNPQKKRDVSICSTLDVNNDEVTITYGYSFRSNHDQFVKRDGRALSYDRMIRIRDYLPSDSSENYAGSFSMEKKEMSYYTVAIQILEKILDNPTTPKKYKEDVVGEIEFLKNRMNSRNERVA